LFFCLFSPGFLDFLVHRPDLPLYPGNSPRFGLGLWNNPVGSIIIESILFAGGVFFYLQKTIAKNRSGKFGLWALIALLFTIQIMNLLGPPPPGIQAIAWAGELQWLFVLIAFWVDHNRVFNQPT